MKAFELQSPILEAIKKKVEELIDSQVANTSKKIKFIYHEPTQDEILAYPDFKNDDGFSLDGVIAVFASNIAGESSSSQTNAPDSGSTITVDCYGIGSVFGESGSEAKSILSAQERAQLLTTVAFKAVMDQTELGLSFGTDIVIGEKRFLNIEKAGSIGAEFSSRGISVYRSTYNLKLEEDVPSEALGLEYDGGEAGQETTNPE